MFITKIIEEKRSKFNGNLRVVKTLGMGTYIQADGLTQSGGIVEGIWRQTLRFLNHRLPSAKHCLILGLGGGSVSKLIKKKYPDIDITGIEIDPIMIDFGKRYLDLDKIDIKIIIGDALEIVKKIDKRGVKFDLIIIDLYNGDKFPEKFETESFFKFVKNLFAKKGIVVFNRLYFGDKRPETVRFGRKLEKNFSKVEWFYPEANLMFVCSK